MGGYFADIIAAYAPTAPEPVDPPWTDPFLDRHEPPLPDASAPLSGEAAQPFEPPPPGAEATIADPPAPVHAPDALFDPPDPLDVMDAAPPDNRVEREVVQREHRIETCTIVEASDVAEPPPAPVYRHENVDRSVTHLHEHFRIVDDSAFEPEPDPAPPPPPDPPPARNPDAPGPDLRLDALQAELARAMARLHGEAAPPAPFFAPEDFEPDTPDAPPTPDPHEIREVTREVVHEVVHEVHHHHHTETPGEPPPAATAPRTAADASRIGKIRFLSDWKTGMR